MTIAREHPHRESLPYPLMLRTWAYEWWRPVVGLLVLVAGAMLFAPLILMPVLAVGILIQGGNFSQEFEAASTLAKVTPAAMLYLNLSLAAMIPLTWLIVRYLHRMRPRWLMSVKPGIRWRFFWACMGLSLVAMAAQLLVSAFAQPASQSGLTGKLQPLSGSLIAMVLVVALTTPLQAMGEEYAFRGYAIQAFGSLTKSPWFAIGLSSVLFALAHGQQNLPLFGYRLLFGLMAGYLVYRTGGLEAGIALHIWNNLVTFGFGIAFGTVQSQLTESTAPMSSLVMSLTQTGVYLLLVLLVAKRMGIDNRSRPPREGARFGGENPQPVR